MRRRESLKRARPGERQGNLTSKVLVCLSAFKKLKLAFFQLMKSMLYKVLEIISFRK